MSVVLVEGLGFGEQGHLCNELSLYSISVQTVNFDDPLGPEFKKTCEQSQLIVFRSRWSASVEDRVFVQLLFNKYQKHFEIIYELAKQKKIKIVGIGRGALLWIQWLSHIKKIGREFEWSLRDSPSTWIDVMVHTNKNSTLLIRGLLSGRAIVAGCDFGGCSVKSWIDSHEATLGWIVDDQIYITLVDVLSLSERAQLPDFGYEDLSAVSTRVHLIQMILSGEV